jgi:hypothetical protein
MGVEVYLVKIDHGEYFELGKGGLSWEMHPLGAQCERAPFILPSIYETPSQLAQHFKKVMLDGWEKRLNDPDFTLFAHKLAGVVWDWCGWDRVMCISDGDAFEFYDVLEYKNPYNIKHIPADKRMVETGNRYI